MTIEELNVVIKANSSQLQSQINKVQNQVNGMAKNTQKASDTMSAAFGKITKAVTAVVSSAAIAAFGKQAIDLASDLQEVQNVVDTAFGSMSTQVDAWAKTTVSRFGVSELAAKQAASTCMAMSKGLGLVGQQAADMAMLAAERTGDIASFYNMSQQEADTLMKSVWTGETESLKRIGVVMTQTNLNAFAMAKGIGKTVDEMTQAEQVQLRYMYVMEQTALAAGDFSKTSGSWANQTRVLTERWKEFMSIVGNNLVQVLTPVVQFLNRCLTSLIAIANQVSSVLSNTFGWNGQEDAAAGTLAMAKAQEELAEQTTAAAEAAKKATLGFDELNILGSKDESSSSDSGSFAFDAGESAVEVSDTTSSIDLSKWEAIKKKLKDIAGYAAVIGAAVAAWKLTGLIGDLATTLPKLVGLKGIVDAVKTSLSKWAVPAGFALSAAGLALTVKGAVDTVTDGIDFQSVGEQVLGAAGLMGGLSLALGKLLPSVSILGKTVTGTLFGGAVGAIVGGVAMFATGLYSAITEKLNWLNGTLTAAGATLAGLGVGMIFGPVGAAIGAAIGLAVGLITDLVVYVVQNWEEISATCEKAFSAIGQFCADIWSGIQETFAPAVQWFSDLFDSIGQTIEDIFYNIGVIASGCWEIISAAWSVVSDWFDENVIQPVVGFFDNLWSDISSAAVDAWEAVKEAFRPAAEFFGNILSEAWEKVTDVFSVAGEIFVDIKDGVLSGFTFVVNGIIDGLNSVIAKPFEGINAALMWLKGVQILGLQPFADLREISIPQTPKLAQGGLAHSATLAMIAEGTHDEAVLPLSAAVYQRIGAGISDNMDNGEQIALLREQNSLLRRLLDKDLTAVATVSLQEIFDGCARANQKAGKTIIPIG